MLNRLVRGLLYNVWLLYVVTLVFSVVIRDTICLDESELLSESSSTSVGQFCVSETQLLKTQLLNALYLV